MHTPIPYSGFTPVRIQGGARFCSGVLIAPDLRDHGSVATDLVLTCAHYFRDIRAAGYTVYSHDGLDKRWHRRVTAVRVIDGTDIAVLKLSRPITGPTPALAVDSPRVGTTCTTIGFGGHSRTARTRRGTLLARLPWSSSKDRATRVDHAGVVWQPLAAAKAVKGDSGGPVFARGAVVGIQSLILDPLGRNLGLATVNLLPRHLPALRRAVAALATD